MARVGVFGGSFNPVHLGHLHIATMAQEVDALDRIVFVPAKLPPHKDGHLLAPEDHRVKMLKLALRLHEDWGVSEIELNESASRFTIDTLDKLAAEAAADTHVFIMGWDSLRDFPTWRDPQGIVDRHAVVAVDRPGVTEVVENPYVSRFRLIRGNPLGIAATDIRTRLAQGRSVRYLLPKQVLDYIHASNLYRQL